MKCFISIVHQHCNDLRISRSAIPEGSVWRGWEDAWFLASFAGGVGGCSRSFFTHFNFFPPPSHNTKVNRKNFGKKKKQEAWEERAKLWLLDGGEVSVREAAKIYIEMACILSFSVICFIIYWGGTGWMTVSSNDDDESCDWILPKLNVARSLLLSWTKAVMGREYRYMVLYFLLF